MMSEVEGKQGKLGHRNQEKKAFKKEEMIKYFILHYFILKSYFMEV